MRLVSIRLTKVFASSKSVLVTIESPEVKTSSYYSEACSYFTGGDLLSRWWLLLMFEITIAKRRFKPVQVFLASVCSFYRLFSKFATYREDRIESRFINKVPFMSLLSSDLFSRRTSVLYSLKTSPR